MDYGSRYICGSTHPGGHCPSGDCDDWSRYVHEPKTRKEDHTCGEGDHPWAFVSRRGTRYGTGPGSIHGTWRYRVCPCGEVHKKFFARHEGDRGWPEYWELVKDPDEHSWAIQEVSDTKEEKDA